MAYMQANEPYSRVDGGITDGALVGSAIGAAASGAFLGGAHLHRRGIPKRFEKKADEYGERMDDVERKAEKRTAKHAAKMNQFSSNNNTARMHMEAENYQQAMGVHQGKRERLSDKYDKYIREDAVNKATKEHLLSTKMRGAGRQAAFIGGVSAASAAIGGTIDYFRN